MSFTAMRRAYGSTGDQSWRGRHQACEVAVVGLGPVGLTLAALLGDRAVDVIAIDPRAEPLPYPRAIAADDEMLRTLLHLPGLSDAAGSLTPAAGSRCVTRAAPADDGRLSRTACSGCPDSRSSTSRRSNGNCGQPSPERPVSGSSGALGVSGSLTSRMVARVQWQTSTTGPQHRAVGRRLRRGGEPGARRRRIALLGPDLRRTVDRRRRRLPAAAGAPAVLHLRARPRPAER